MTNNRRNSFLKSITIFSVVVCLLLNFVFFLLQANNAISIGFYIYVICYIVCFLYFVVSVFLIKTKGFFTIPNILWLCLFVFGLSRVYMYIFGLFNFRSAEYGILGTFVWKDETTIQVLNYYLIFMCAFSICIIAIRVNHSKARMVIYDKKCNNILLILFYISAFFTALYFALKAALVVRLGYASIYNGDTNGSIPFERVFSLFRLLFVVSYYFVIAYDTRKSIYKTTTILFLIINGIALIQGSRAEFLIYLLASLCIYYYRFGRQFRTFTVVLTFVIGIPVLEFISYFRSGFSIGPSFLKDCYVEFFTELSGSFNVPAFYLQNKEALSINTYPYIFEPLVKVIQYFQNIRIYGGGQTTEMAKIRFNLGHQITFLISPDYYLQGHNFASNFIAEMSEFGFFGVVLFSFVVSLLVLFIEKRIIAGSKYWTFMSFELCMWIFFLPRGSAFYDTYNILKFGLIFLVGSFVFDKRRKEKTNNQCIWA